ncbi:hypothetical protein NSB24_01395 [Blautia coccoides]|uniref:hypothetical protein n=1 Tax=Lachnospiraceae TaxID=186803 RepID=UPI002149B704|nr:MULTISPECIES: hypothetical protein [Lachnospiraceae]MCR1984889.1 hypothetical protein [Blautia coccoides]MCU0077851.1 hypothetical protein [Extibacter muris]
MQNIGKFKRYCSRFLYDESGMEMLQFAIILVITVGLIAACVALKNVVESNINNASEEANEQMGSLLNP